MEHRVHISNRAFQPVLEEGELWLERNVGEKGLRWNVATGFFGSLHIMFLEEEDKVMFILRYGDYIV